MTLTEIQNLLNKWVETAIVRGKKVDFAVIQICSGTDQEFCWSLEVHHVPSFPPTIKKEERLLKSIESDIFGPILAHLRTQEELIEVLKGTKIAEWRLDDEI